MEMTGGLALDGQASIWLALAVGAVATYVWRALGVVLAGRMAPTGPLVAWMGCVAYAMLAGLIFRMILQPIGPLAETSMLVRVVGAGLAFALFYGLGRRLLPAVVAGSGGLAVLHALGL